VLFIVLVMVLAALGLVVTALVTAHALWAWFSIGLSALAGLLLVVDWFRRRSRTGAKGATVRELGGEPAAEGESGRTGAGTARGAEATGAAEATSGTAVMSNTTPTSGAASIGTAESDDGDDGTAKAWEPGAPPEGVEAAESSTRDVTRVDEEPAEEQTHDADRKLIAELDAEVLVVDEHPRYHLAECGWLEGRATIPLPVNEARVLGFTPCARCGPDARFAADRRGKRAFRR
jgi:hypothetical protein